MNRLQRKRRAADRAIRAVAAIQRLTESSGADTTRRVVVDEMLRLARASHLGHLLGMIGAAAMADSLMFLPIDSLEQFAGVVEQWLASPIFHALDGDPPEA